jgi:hypothetical protein
MFLCIGDFTETVVSGSGRYVLSPTLMGLFRNIAVMMIL